MKTYKIKTRFIFDGVFLIKADNKEDAKRMVMDNCGMTLGKSISTILDVETANWIFDTHPKKIILNK
jgi:hypothetical protein